MKLGTALLLALLFLVGCSAPFATKGKAGNKKDSENTLKLNTLDYFEARGLNVLAFSNWYDVNFLMIPN